LLILWSGGISYVRHSLVEWRAGFSFLVYTISKNALTVLPEQHPEDQADQGRKENQQEAAQSKCNRALLLRFWPGYAEGRDETLYQKIQQSHDVSQYRRPLPLMLIPLSPIVGREPI
jgi:hypothetical protein